MSISGQQMVASSVFTQIKSRTTRLPKSVCRFREMGWQDRSCTGSFKDLVSPVVSVSGLKKGIGMIRFSVALGRHRFSSFRHCRYHLSLSFPWLLFKVCIPENEVTRALLLSLQVVLCPTVS